MSALSLRHVKIQYLHRRTREWLLAVDDISLHTGAGTFTAILGPSGCGKTSILNAVAGIVPIESGQIIFDGEPVHGPGQERAMVFQSPSLLPWRSVLRNVTYGLEIQGVPFAEAEQRARAYIELVGLDDFVESFPAELSGGMQQRINLARALATHPKLLLFDEPLSALDAQLRDYMQLELLRIWQQLHITALYVTHQIREAIFLADQIVVMSQHPGKIIEILSIDLPRPRRIELRRTPAFLDLEMHLWELLRANAQFELV